MNRLLNRRLVEESFIKYTDRYDSNDEKIKLKIEHTYRVAYLSEAIAKSIGMKSEDIDLAWLIGMLHDIGRFEQIKRYGTFEDAKSVSHAKLGTAILFDDGLIDMFGDICIDNKDILRVAILYHSDYVLPQKLSDREMTFCNIIRDADKIDILKVVYESSPEVIYGVPESVLKLENISNNVMKCFDDKHAVLRTLRKTHIDNIVGYASFVYELVYPESRRICAEQGYLWNILNFKSDLNEVNEKIHYMKEKLKKFLNE